MPNVHVPFLAPKRIKTSENSRKNKCSQKILQKISLQTEDITSAGFWSIPGYLRNFRGRLFSSEKSSEVFTHWPNPKKGAPETENPFCIGFTALRGGIETMV